MNKNDNLHILSKTLMDTLPREYSQKFDNNETGLILTEENSDLFMYVSPDEHNADDIIVAVLHDDTDKGYVTEYETLHWTIENDQIPLSDILTDIKNYI